VCCHVRYVFVQYSLIAAHIMQVNLSDRAHDENA